MHIWLLMIIHQLENWIESIKEKRPGLVSGEEGRKTVDFIEKCYAHRQRLNLPWEYLK